MKHSTNFTTKVLALVLTIAALATGQRSAFAAENGWEISSSTSGSVTTFTISRTNTAVAETVKYRFVNLSAYAGQHYNVTKVNGANSSALTGEFTFAAGETGSRTIIQVTESAGSGAYSYYKDNTQRSYKLELTDAGGFYLTKNQRSFTTGTSVNSSNVYAEQSVTVASGPVTITHDGFDQGYHAVSMSTYFSNAAPQAYLVAAGAELRMVVTLDEAEKDDGYQHIQLLVNKTTSFDDNASEGNPGTPTNSHYLASFAHKPGSTLTTYASVCFPLTSATDNCSAVDPAWNFSPYNNTVGKLYTQKFKSGYRASDGKLIVAKKSELNGLSTVGIRFDASGDNADTWYAKNVTAKFTAVDETAPTVITYSVAPGVHSKGNTVYVSVVFSEIVTTSSAKLTSSWGDLAYVAGSGTNVLTFSRTIPASASSALSITGYSGIADLAGNAPSSVNSNNLCSLDANYVYTISYDLDGGSVATENYANYTYETAAFTLNNPIKPGYSFDGWTGSNGNTPQNTVTIANHSHGNKTYTANWTPITYTLRLHHNDGTNNYTDLAMTYDQAKTIQSVSRTGFTITGWSNSPTGAVVYTDGQSVSNLTTNNGDIIDLYAQWTINTYSVHFNANGGSGEMTNEQFTYSESKALTANGFTREGYTFAGWSTTTNGDVVYADGQVVSNLTTTNGATIDLYAKWTAHTYSVHFDANGGTGTMDDQSFTYNQEQELSANAFTCEGNVFVGWNTAADGTGTWYTPLNYYMNLTTLGDVVILYAQWMVGRKVSYIDADGTEKHENAILITSSQTEYGFSGNGTTREVTHWYVVSGEVSLSNLWLEDDYAHLILEDDARLTINSSKEVAFRTRNITIYGQSNGTGQLIASSENSEAFGTGGYSITINGGNITATSGSNDGIYSNGKPITINGGNVTATSGSSDGISGSKITINGGNVTATGGHIGINGGKITINGGNVTATGDSFGIYIPHVPNNNDYLITLAGGTVWANSYNGIVRTNNCWYTNGTNIIQGNLHNIDIAGKTMQPALRLDDKDNFKNNITTIAEHNGETIAAVQLYSRKLYKDGDWNTLCLPFSLTAEQMAASPLAGAEARTLSSASYADGTLTLNFSEPVESLTAGTPYIIKWEKANDYVDDNEHNIVNPIFTNVTIDNTAQNVETTNVSFVGTYGYRAFAEENKSILLVGAGNSLYYPLSGASLGACRAYFQLNGITAGDLPANGVKMFFGEEDDATSLSGELRVKSEESDNAVYDLSGRKVNSQFSIINSQLKKGLYIKNGKKVLINK